MPKSSSRAASDRAFQGIRRIKASQMERKVSPTCKKASTNWMFLHYLKYLVISKKNDKMENISTLNVFRKIRCKWFPQNKKIVTFLQNHISQNLALDRFSTNEASKFSNQCERHIKFSMNVTIMLSSEWDIYLRFLTFETLGGLLMNLILTLMKWFQGNIYH